MTNESMTMWEDKCLPANIYHNIMFMVITLEATGNQDSN